jgi:hypothetical protein
MITTPFRQITRRVPSEVAERPCGSQPSQSFPNIGSLFLVRKNPRVSVLGRLRPRRCTSMLSSQMPSGACDALPSSAFLRQHKFVCARQSLRHIRSINLLAVHGRAAPASLLLSGVGKRKGPISAHVTVRHSLAHRCPCASQKMSLSLGGCW